MQDRSFRSVRLGERFVAAMAAAVLWNAGPAAALPPASEFFQMLGLSADDVAQVNQGEIFEGATKSSDARELVATMAFVVPGVKPADILARGKGGLLDKVDADTIAYEMIAGEPGLASFAKLQLEPATVQQFAAASPGESLNLSSSEIATFAKLGKGAAASAVESAVRAMLSARLDAYRANGLAGIAPYQRSDGQRSAGDDLRSATEGTQALAKVAPNAYQALLQYPNALPAGAEQGFRWTYLKAHGEPALALTHSLYLPEGDGAIAVQRQFYVSAGYNCEQAVAAFVPVTEGTAVFYINRTSTDQVMGFGGGAKRSIGSKVMAGQLKQLLANARKAVETK